MVTPPLPLVMYPMPLLRGYMEQQYGKHYNGDFQFSSRVSWNAIVHMYCE